MPTITVTNNFLENCVFRQFCKDKIKFMKISEKAASAMYHLRQTNGFYPAFKYKFKMTFHLKLDKYLENTLI